MSNATGRVVRVVIRHAGLRVHELVLALGLVLVATFSLMPGTAEAQALRSDAARGKTVLYVHNMTKLEGARKAEPVDPKRIAALETWRRNDEEAMDYLRSLGFKVVAADETAPPEASNGKDLIIISESVDAVNVGTKYRSTPVPLITCENDLLGELEMTGLKNGTDYGTDENQRFLWLVNAPHPLAAGLAAGIQNVLLDEHYKMNWGKPALGAVTIATLRGEPEKAAIFSYERGATMNGEFLAPARRVSFFLWQDTFEQMRPEGVSLFRAAVLWAVTPPA